MFWIITGLVGIYHPLWRYEETHSCVQSIEYQYTLAAWYIAVPYKTTMNTQRKKETYNFVQNMNPQATPHNIPSRASYGVSFVSSWERRGIKSALCNEINLALSFHITNREIKNVWKSTWCSNRCYITNYFNEIRKSKLSCRIWFDILITINVIRLPN